MIKSSYTTKYIEYQLLMHQFHHKSVTTTEKKKRTKKKIIQWEINDKANPLLKYLIRIIVLIIMSIR